jgi:hypothetical protein
MLNAIKRTWVPKTAATQAPVAQAPAPVMHSIYAGLSMFDGLPTPQAEEINGGDSIWAVFEDVQPMSVAR